MAGAMGSATVEADMGEAAEDVDVMGRGDEALVLEVDGFTGEERKDVLMRAGMRMCMLHGLHVH